VPVHFLSPFPGTFQANEDLREKLSMRQTLIRSGLTIALFTMALAATVHADATITTFDGFNSDALFNSWSSPFSTVTSGPTSYSIEATGYGSNYKYIEDPGRIGAGNTHLELTVSLAGPAAADGQLGPLVQLIDADGSHYHFRWYGQLLGSHVLTRPVDAPDFISNPGSIAGLNLNGLIHMHMELDPGGFGTSGEYTVTWENLSLVTPVPEPSSLLLVASCCGTLLMRRR
jgi:hypothetical protein